MVHFTYKLTLIFIFLRFLYNEDATYIKNPDQSARKFSSLKKNARYHKNNKIKIESRKRLRNNIIVIILRKTKILKEGGDYGKA